MSVVPYQSNGQIVYHDSNHGILVVHHNDENRIQLLADPSHRYFHRKCPNCGFSWEEQTPEPVYDSNPQFMHSDYFKVLASLPYHKEELPFSTPLPRDIFNQGYFERFFRKIPPYVLGSGAHAQVYKVMHVLNDVELGTYAVKRISIGDHSAFLEQVLTEVLILYELSEKGANENLIRYNHVWLEIGDMQDSTTFILGPTSNDKIPYVYILMQYCAGENLEDLITKNFSAKHMSMRERVELERQRRRSKTTKLESKWLSDVEIWKLFRDVANGVAFLHSHGILHRDLKPSNCLLEGEYRQVNGSFETVVELLPRVVISDFGEGKFINKQYLAAKEDEERHGNTGTLEFTAPELWLYANYDPSSKKQLFAHGFTYLSDIYSLGLILCWLCVGTLPFSDATQKQNDPEKVREEISQWYNNLTQDSFSEWFHRLLGPRTLTPVLDQLQGLIYLMLKNGDDSISRISCNQVLEYLDGITWVHRPLRRPSVVEEPCGRPLWWFGACFAIDAGLTAMSAPYAFRLANLLVVALGVTDNFLFVGYGALAALFAIGVAQYIVT